MKEGICIRHMRLVWLDEKKCDLRTFVSILSCVGLVGRLWRE